MNTIDEEISLVVEGLRDSANDTPGPARDKVLVPQFVPTRYEIMIMLKHYIERAYGPRLVQQGSDVPYDMRVGGTMALIRLLFGDEELERLESRYLRPVHKKCKERARRLERSDGCGKG